MLARILGVLLLIGGVALGVELIWPLFGGLFGLLGAVAVVLLAAGALYIGLRLLRGESIVGRVVGALVLLAGIWLAFWAALSLVSGIFGIAFLLLQVALVLAMLYVGWRWLDNGEFSLRRWRV
ncbi:MAG: hypothetical protein F4X17_19735 [Gemmatimonadetes bacterium]|nr:hypothetical protein [Gemmatimonadota bacterium]MYI61107.1 hypothetical protein [Gemmatimonadota bacterium]